MGRTRTALTLPLVDIAATVADGTATTLPPGKAATLTEGVVYRLAEAIFALHTVLDTTLDTLAPLDFADANEMEPGSMWDDLMRTWSGVLPVGMMEEEESESDQVGAGAA